MAAAFFFGAFFGAAAALAFFFAGLSSGKRRYYELARGIFEDLRRRGHAAGVNPRVAILSLYGMMNWIYKWYNSKVDPHAEELAEAMADIFLNGVQDGRGRKASHAMIVRQRPPKPGVRAAG